MLSKDILGHPARQLLLQLAGSNELERTKAARRIWLFLCKQPKDKREEFHWPQTDRLELFRQLVTATFCEDGFPVVPTVRTLATNLIQSKVKFTSSLNTSWNFDKHQSRLDAVSSLVLEYAAPAAVSAFDVYLELLNTKLESGEVGFDGLRWMAARAFRTMGREGLPAFDSLFVSLADSSSEELEKTLCAQLELEPALHEKVRTALQSSQDNVRYTALSLLEKIGPGFQNLREAAIHALTDVDGNCRGMGGTILRRYFSEDSTALESLNRARERAGSYPRPFQLEEPAMALEPSVLALAERDEDDPVFQKAVLSLRCRFIPASEVEQQNIADFLARPDVPTASIAKKIIAKILDYIRKRNPTAVEPYITAATLCSVIEHIGPSGAGAVDDLIAILPEIDNAHAILDSTTNALRNLGAAGIKAIPALLEKSRSHPNASYSCTQTLSAFCAYEPELIQKLCGWIEIGSPAERTVAVSVLRNYAPGARTALPFALKFADAGGTVNAEHVAPIFAAVAAESEPARRHLIQLTQHADGGIRGHALSALSAIPDIPEAVRLLEIGLKDEYAYARCCALMALCELNIPAAAKVQYCVSMLDDDEGFDDYIPSNVAMTELVKLGASAAPAIPQLLRASISVPEFLQILDAVGLAARPALPWLKETLQQNMLYDPFLEDPKNLTIEKLIARLQ